MNQTLRIRPSLWQCLWALPFILIGGGFFAYTLVHGITHVTDSLTQIVVPGSADLSLKPGEYSVFLEEESVVNGKIYSTSESVNGLSCRIRSVQNGSPIPMARSTANVTYSVNGRSGRSVLEFAIQQAGKYSFACDYDAGTKGPRVVVAVGSGAGKAIVSAVGEGLLSFFGGFGCAAVVVLVIVVKRERAKRRIGVQGQAQI